MLLALVALGIWLLILSLVFIWFYLFFRRLTKGTKENELTQILSRILKTQDDNAQTIAAIEKEIGKIEEADKLHVQKIGIVRFNPFKEIGGDHSFSLAILDGVNSGVIITCLHTRERTRVYMKGITKGKSELELSEEEKKALAKVT
jgi:hypothetical protein